MDGIQWVELTENDELFSKIPAHLTSLAAQGDMSSEEFQQAQAENKRQFTQAANNLIKQPFSFHARIQLEFELIPTSV